MLIDELYLVNFTEKEKQKFRQEQDRKSNDLWEYQKKLYELIYSNSPDIFANYLIEPNSSLEVRYMLNRVLMDDPTCQSFHLTKGDEVKGVSVFDIGFAFAHNTHCRQLELSGFHLKSLDLMWLLNSLKKNKLENLNLAENDWQDNSLTYLLHQMSHKENAWQKVELGSIEIDTQMKEKLKDQPRISFKAKAPKSPYQFLSFLCRSQQKTS